MIGTGETRPRHPLTLASMILTSEPKPSLSKRTRRGLRVLVSVMIEHEPLPFDPFTRAERKAIRYLVNVATWSAGVGSRPLMGAAIRSGMVTLLERYGFLRAVVDSRRASMARRGCEHAILPLGLLASMSAADRRAVARAVCWIVFRVAMLNERAKPCRRERASNGATRS